ncbi:hypothetical protein EWE75_01340 [Sphingomonas populi]|uniref:Uncharacterized protein n=1 Tax=Sphingomonas populi TaxID=2484750 RepID=A0A4Q6Y1P5_9SPHN|nr:hypothetical protein [Sphingomonas populi]RZF66525.1 hypothetical protein EWE75_01340 [Sphingomonas populi]
MMKALLIALALVSAPVAAQEAPVELWGGITYLEPGMSVHNAYPKHGVYLTPKCHAGIDWTVDGTKEKRLTTLTLGGGSISGDGCMAMVRAGMRAKYGEPVSSTVTPPTPRDHATWTTQTYQNATVQITLKTREGDEFGEYWDAVYSPRSVAESMASKL